MTPKPADGYRPGYQHGDDPAGYLGRTALATLRAFSYTNSQPLEDVARQVLTRRLRLAGSAGSRAVRPGQLRLFERDTASAISSDRSRLVHGLDRDMEVKAKQHERPEEHGQDERQQFANTSEYVSVSVSYHRTDN
jgi:hypothetical protein